MITRGQWAEMLCKELGVPVSKRNQFAIVAWMSAEGTSAKFNPLATTRNMPGATNFNSVGVKNYLNLKDGLDATVLTLQEPGHNYEPIIKRLRKSVYARKTLAAVRDSAWGTGGLALFILHYIKVYFNSYWARPIGQ